ncbi:DNA primase [Candidatus Thiosymbion oneisti]|uniref:DNA primase n=1 Tax=Candidatus Thiosymbion oneisti TaxID=589554 RepID=UPI000B292FE1|nr:DNA primase [Candidatus Thiosymbion oneisti]
MAGRIPPEFIDALLARTDIVNLINSRVSLRKAGKDYQACCPFHDEKTPSFTVSPDKQFYHCFGCGAHGSAIGFLMEYERQEFREAVEELAQQAGMEIPVDGEGVRAGPDLRPLYDLLDQTAQLYRRQLRQHPSAPRAVEYLKGRGLSGEVAAAFGLGFAPPGWDFLLGTLGGSAQVRERLLQGGLVIEQDGRRYDRFRDRIMFPIRDRRGRVIGFGGRVLGDEKPKYLNSPETPVFHKGRELYGLYEAQQAKRRLERLLVVEGYLDVIALAQFGITYAVATLGTATSAEHLRLLLRAAPELIFCFDGDRAGRDAAWKALETALPLATGRQQIGFLFLPEGDDPDTLIRCQGRTEFEQHLDTATPLSDFLFDRLAAQVDMSSLDGRARLATLAKPLLDRVPAGLFRDMLGTRLAKLVGVARNRLDTGTGAGRRRTGSPEPHKRPPREWLVVALVLQQPRLAAQLAELDDDWKTLDQPGLKLLSELLERIAADPELTTAQLVHHLEDSLDEGYRHYLSRLTDPALLAGIPEAGRAADLCGAIKALNAEARDAKFELLCRRASLSELDDEEKQGLRGYRSDTRRDGL